MQRLAFTPRQTQEQRAGPARKCTSGVIAQRQGRRSRVDAYHEPPRRPRNAVFVSCFYIVFLFPAALFLCLLICRLVVCYIACGCDKSFQTRQSVLMLSTSMSMGIIICGTSMGSRWVTVIILRGKNYISLLMPICDGVSLYMVVFYFVLR